MCLTILFETTWVTQMGNVVVLSTSNTCIIQDEIIIGCGKISLINDNDNYFDLCFAI